MKPKHTPGPWRVDKDIKDVGYDKKTGEKLADEIRYFIYPAIKKTGEGFNLAYVNSYGVREVEANANLLAAAPELLDASEIALAKINEFFNLLKGVPIGDEFIPLEQARSALIVMIAKARGEK